MPVTTFSFVCPAHFIATEGGRLFYAHALENIRLEMLSWIDEHGYDRTDCMNMGCVVRDVPEGVCLTMTMHARGKETLGG